MFDATVLGPGLMIVGGAVELVSSAVVVKKTLPKRRSMDDVEVYGQSLQKGYRVPEPDLSFEELLNRIDGVTSS